MEDNIENLIRKAQNHLRMINEALPIDPEVDSKIEEFMRKRREVVEVPEELVSLLEKDSQDHAVEQQEQEMAEGQCRIRLARQRVKRDNEDD